ncbi:hypothetical protein [Lelliottia nimipressuralis]|uniref:hypothetical protein n=1 Tax=Lelliottia nimipressuralis TaxID=69220 RepID=UPI001E322158|nr:hypothetical protein [Lelliottia nimipressuralis]MCD4561888.1 hypothetical protein [Lelliottia nimipressuralis]
MDVVKLKGYVSAIICILLLSYAIDFILEIGLTLIKALINSEDYIFYDPKDIPLLLCIPVAIFLEVVCICALLPFKPKTAPFLQKLMIPVTIYGVASFAIGFIISIIISFYPLGTDYYKCHSTSIISSGSRYAKSKEICSQRGSGGYYDLLVGGRKKSVNPLS